MKIEVLRNGNNGDIIRLLEPVKINWKGKRFTIPKGFESDGCSVPQFLWGNVSPAIDPRTLRGAVAHDFIYRTHPPNWTKKEADKMFYNFIRADGLNWWRANKAYYGVRIFGGSSWKGK